MRNFVRLAQTLRRHHRREPTAGFGLHGGNHLGVHQPRGDGRGADPVTGQFLRPKDRQGRDPGLGGGVIRLAEISRSRQAGDVDDHASRSETGHVDGRLAGAQEGSGEIDVQHCLPIAKRHLAEQLAVLEFHQETIAGDAGVVDQHVQRAAIRGHRVHERDHVLLFGYVGAVAVHLSAGLFALSGRVLEAVALQIA